MMLGSRRSRSLLSLGAIALLLVASNIIVGRYGALRLDLTAEHLYTLAKGTRQTLATVKEPITLRLYYSHALGDRASSYGVYAQRVRELLDQYVAAAHGKLRLEIYDPQPFSDAEDRAVAFGLQAVPLNDQGEAVYFGLAGTNSTDDQQVIPFFDPPRARVGLPQAHRGRADEQPAARRRPDGRAAGQDARAACHHQPAEAGRRRREFVARY
jgi:ABC-type uncharacterized transport system involved in gliding motility auxiliary subunit